MVRMISHKDRLNIIIITLIAAMLFIPFLGGVHLFDWDEINFAESAREMIRSGDYLTVQIDYYPFWEKPPLFIWMQVLSMKIFGINEFAARFPNALAGIITLLVLYFSGRNLRDRQFGWLWSLVYAGSMLPHLYFKSGIIDPWFNLFIFVGIIYMIRYTDPGHDHHNTRYTILSAVFIGLAILTKGPVALLIFGLVAFIWMVISKQWRIILNFKFLGIYILFLILVGGLWFSLQILNGHANVIMDFIRYQIRLFTQEDAGHGGFLLYHFVVLFVGVFPASIFMLPSFRQFKDDHPSIRRFKTWMMVTFWVVLILFTIVNTKIVHYSSLCYFPMSFLATSFIYDLKKKNLPLRNWLKSIVGVMAIFFGLVPIAIQLFIKYKESIIESGKIHDAFAVGNLQAEVPWSGWEFMVGLILLTGVFGSLWLFRKHPFRQIMGIFISSLLFVNLTIMIIVPKVEGYSQNAAIEFFKGISGEDCYVDTWGYKSYAHLFYFRKPPPGPVRNDDLEHVLTGDIEKKVYVSVKNIKASDFSEQYPGFIRLFEKNGFVFFVREP